MTKRNERTTCLRDVTPAASSAELRELARFVSQMADEIDEFGSGFDHDHCALFVCRRSDAEYWGGDVTVVNPTYLQREDRGDATLARVPRLVRAARLGDVAAVTDLLASGHDVDAADPDGWTALLAACEISALHDAAPLGRAMSPHPVQRRPGPDPPAAMCIDRHGSIVPHGRAETRTVWAIGTRCAPKRATIPG